MKSLRLLITVTWLVLSDSKFANGNGINYRLSQPQIYVDDGHLYFVPAEHRNLVLISNGTGRIMFNDVQLEKIVGGIKNLTREQKAIREIFGNPSNSSGFRVARRLRSLEQRMEQQLDQVETIDGRIITLERQMSAMNSSDISSQVEQDASVATPRELRRRILRLERRFNTLTSQNPCTSNPCQNSGSCMPSIFGPFCFCQPGWEGNLCQIDVNECTNFADSALGCQNGALCVNTPGSYQCNCRSGWVGVHCTVRTGDCSSGPAWELCGHGICVNQQTGSRPYTCICEQGWKSDSMNVACNVDIDECNGRHASCSVNPPVACVNTPGSFHCGPCPPGYTGNGFQCQDINECAQNNGGCSINPNVQCINTIGSRTCGECPPGFAGDGVNCQYVGMCQMNNGGCHPLARCIQNTVIGQSYVQCLCPAGYTGYGMGPQGCVLFDRGGTDTGSNSCQSNPCVHGTCIPNGNTFICTCSLGFSGPTCSQRLDPCSSNPCQNNGTCTSNSNGFVCQCLNDFTGLRCETQEEACGGSLRNVAGTLRYPHDSGRGYKDRASCMWTINTDRDKVLNLTFTRFHLEGGEPCQFDWLQIHDGFHSGSPMIGKYCGENLPNGGSIVSTHDVIFLWFRSDHSTVGLGFELNWNSTEPVCGETITGLTHGSINSPGYPGYYPHNRDCLWTISVSPAKRIQLLFATVKIEVHPNCLYDYLQIQDGYEETAPVLEKYCNTTVPPPLISSGPYLRLLFHTDGSATDTGFHITFAEVPGVPGCGGVYSDSQGVFTSPQHPEPYPHGLDCEYLIRLPSPDERLTLTFTEFNLESGSNCRYDSVEIRDGGSPDSPLVGRFCERNRPSTIISTTNLLLVRFRSDSSVTFGGFRAKYESLCGGTFSTPTGILRSPYYPQPYPNNRDCIFIIQQPVNKAILLDFSDFDVEGATPNSCSFDFLEIRDGDTANSTLVGHFCGPLQSKPDRVLSSYNYLWLRFKTDGSVQNRGFLGNYSTVDLSCGGILREKHGVVASPGHPEVYPHGVVCTWIIRGLPGEVIRLNWVSFNLERNLRCVYDYVEIYDNSTLLQPTNTNGSLIGRYCGQEFPPQLTSSDYTITIRFKSDHSISRDGFMANYLIVNSSTVCGGNYFTESGLLQSPGYPNNYPPGKSCLWLIRVPIGRQIKLNITDFGMENGTSRGCYFDFLEIRNGGLETSPLVGRFCGSNLPPRMIPSSSNSFWLKFISDSSGHGSGFRIFWDGTSSGCGSKLKTPSGSLVSPNYPSSIGARLECIWNIVVNQGSAIQFTFIDLDLSRSTSCWGEFVELRDGPLATSPVLGKYCTAESTLAVNSTGNNLRVKFVSRQGVSGRGFHATYQTICTRTIFGHSGVIESPNFPEPYPHNRNCSWNVEVPLGNKVNISFSHFSVQDLNPTRENCRYDFVEVLESQKSMSSAPPALTSLGKFCGNDLPPLIPTSKEIATVHFESDSFVAQNGFRLEWVVNGCGGKILGGWGRLTSPNYPRPYSHSVICDWYIETSLGTRASLTVYDLDLERSDQCIFDALMIYGGPDENSGLLTQLCHTSTTALTYTSFGNKMFVRFRADSSVTAKGFSGYINQIDGGCGGYYTAPTGFIYSPNYPANYEHSTDCGWRITVDNTHVVELQFLDFNVERHNNCSFDHVAVYDGPTRMSPQLWVHCGNGLPDVSRIRSTGNTMFVRLKTDASNSAKGFKANYTTGCGARLSGMNRGTIKTPGFPHLMYRVNCTWFISGTRPEDRVTLTFTHLDIQSTQSPNCEKDWVQVLDGEDFDAPSVGKYCFNRVPPAITSRGNSLVVQITTQDSWGFGFRANYDISSGACGGELTSAEGSFVSPNFPNGYPPSTECAWTIKASRGNRVHVSFRNLDIEANDFCNTDFVEVHEVGPSGPLLGHFCGNEIPANISAAETLWVLFRSDAEGQAPGFLADYALVHGVELSGSVGFIESPLYPNPIYTSGTYTWRILVNESRAIRIRFMAFDFEFDTTTPTCGNYLKIFDGYDENSLELLYACDMNLPGVITSSGNVVKVVMFRDMVRVSSIFQLKWEEISLREVIRNVFSSTNVTGCGGTIDLSLGNDTSLLSPGYNISLPFSGYLPNLRCEWIINSPPNYRVQIKVENMDLEFQSTCLYDKVEIYNDDGFSPTFVLNKTLCQRTDRNMVLVSSGRTIKILFITDGGGSRTGFNFTLTPICGGTVRDTRGRITSPNYPQNYGLALCTWIVVVRPGRTIHVAIRRMDIYKGPQTDCNTDLLFLRNGGHDDSPFLGPGRFCGTTVPSIPIPDTVGNQLYIRFQASTTGGTGFELIFNEVSIGCGGQVHLTDEANEFTFSSLNYPHVPPPYAECEWVFTVPQNEVVQIDFQLSFQLRPDCSMEAVEIRDGGTRLSPVISTFCGNYNNQLPPTQKSTGNIIYVRYYTNTNEPGTGFKARASVGTCGGTMAGWYGVITSPGYPLSYGVNLDCWWTVRVSEGSFMFITFVDLEVGTKPISPGGNNETGFVNNCTRDLVQITENNITEIRSPRTWNFCGVGTNGVTSSLPARIQTSRNVIHIRFKSDGTQETRKGFKLTYMQSRDRCGSTIEGQPSGIIESPNYPRPYPSYRWCRWTIKAPPNRRVRLVFVDFDLEHRIITPTSSYCVDYVDVTSPPSTLYWDYVSSMYNGSVCGSTVPSPVETTSEIMSIAFNTDGSVGHRGFRARFTTDLPSICGGNLVGNSGTVTSPLERTGTPNETTAIRCVWSHSGESENATTIVSIRSMTIPPSSAEGLQPSTNCNDGSVKVISSGIQSYYAKKYCGHQSNLKLYLPGSSFNIEYSVRHWESSFNLTYDVIGCGGLVMQPNGTIQSPNFPTSYAPNIECIWKVNFPRGQVQLAITDMDLDDHVGDDGCDRDYVLVRNGLYGTSPILGKYCGTLIPPVITSMSTSLWVEFHSDENENGNRRGFRIETQILERGCGGTIHSKRGSFSSPRISGTPASMKYPNNVECEWTVETVPGYMLSFEFTDRFDIEAQTNCTNDFVEFFQRNGSTWNSVAKFCGRQLPPILRTMGAVKILFRSNAAINGDGFNLNWFSICGGLYGDESGVIRSAHYDRWNHSYHVNPGSFWSRSYVRWENTYAVQPCYYLVQGITNDDYVVLKFLDPFGVTVPASSGFQIADLVQTCPLVNVTVWGGNTSQVQSALGGGRYVPRLGGPFCGEDVPPGTFVSHKSMTIAYNYMGYFETFGFRAEYNIYRCGGEVREPTSIESPHPFTAAPNMNCTWVVRAPPGKVVRFKFDFLQLEFSSSCSYDYVNLYDGDWSNRNLRPRTFCGNLTEDLGRFVSTGPAMTIQFITDYSYQRSGFKGSVDFTIGPASGCGGEVNLTGIQTIQSPDSDSDGNYDTYLDCQWSITGPDFQVLEISFTSFSVEVNQTVGDRLLTDDNCRFDFIEIRDGRERMRAPSLGKFCGSTLPQTLTSSSNFLWINFVSDGSYQFTGFRASISSRPSPCGPSFILNATTTAQLLNSPEYPRNYGSNIRCRWILTGMNSYDEVDIRFLELNIEPSPDCSKDRLQIKDVSSSYATPEGISGPILFNGVEAVDWRFRYLDDIDHATIMKNFKYCGSVSPSDFVSVGRNVELLFESDASGSGRGFQLEYRAAACNRTYDAPQGRIFSPEFPANSPYYTNCIKMITSPNDTKISIYFNDFRLYDNVDCRETFFEVREGGADGELRGRYCGSSRPDPVFSTTNALWINYVTRVMLSRGFDFSYTTTAAGSGCGGDLFHTGGSFTSPFYPGNYSSLEDCTWRLRVPAGLKINLVFTAFQITGDCNATFVEISSMDSHDMASSPVLFTRHCPMDIPSTYNGNTDMAMVRYKSNLNNTGMGWRIQFTGRESSGPAVVV